VQNWESSGSALSSFSDFVSFSFGQVLLDDPVCIASFIHACKTTYVAQIQVWLIGRNLEIRVIDLRFSISPKVRHQSRGAIIQICSDRLRRDWSAGEPRICWRCSMQLSDSMDFRLHLIGRILRWADGFESRFQRGCVHKSQVVCTSSACSFLVSYLLPGS
jgi:hypothetical protein